MKNLTFTIFGILFGIVLTKSEVISWFRIQKMFLFEEPHMYLVIGSAVIVGILAVALLKVSKIKSLNGEPFDYTGKEDNKGIIYGGMIFGIGWAITGACPGPIFAQIGAGESAAIVTLTGALTGAFLHAKFKSKLPQ